MRTHGKAMGAEGGRGAMIEGGTGAAGYFKKPAKNTHTTCPVRYRTVGRIDFVSYGCM